MNYWRQYWSDKGSAGHRFENEEFYTKMARERLYHLDGGDTLLDFGCGSGELLGHYATAYGKVAGADFSETMLEAAKRNLAKKGSSAEVELFLADENTVWDRVPGFWDRITASQVVQYFDNSRLDRFVLAASQKLNPSGKVALFDIIDPQIYLFYRIGLLDSRRRSFLGALIRMVGITTRTVHQALRGIPSDEIGKSYRPDSIRSISAKHGLRMEYVCSLYYEYRYHAVLSKPDS